MPAFRHSDREEPSGGAFHAFSELYGELRKVAFVTATILRRYARLPFPKEDTKEFFAEVYVRHSIPEIGRSFARKIPTRELHEIFPGIQSARIQTYAGFDFHRKGIFSKDGGSGVSPFELYALSALVRHLSPESIFEFGTSRGLTTANLALNAPRGARIDTIDIQRIASGDPAIDQIFQDRNIVRIFGDSTKFGISKHERAVDFIFVDADHSRDFVMSDSKNALEMVSPAGTIVWHDFSAECPGVVEALDHLSATHPLVHVRRSNLVIFSRRTAPI